MVKVYDTDFVIRLRMSLHRKGIDWHSSTRVGDFLGRSKQTAHQWLRGQLPATKESFDVADRLDVPAKWLFTGVDAPDWVRYMSTKPFEEPDDPGTTRRVLPTRKRAFRSRALK